MDKYIYDDKNDLWYELQGDYYIPCLILPAEKEQPIGLWGQRHLQYLKEYRRITYLNLLTSGRLNAYLADIDKQTEEMFFRLVEQMKQAQGIMEQLKAENALEWTGRLNNIRACAREIVIRQRRQGEISAAVLLGGGAHDSFLAIVRLTEYNISTNNVEVCYV